MALCVTGSGILRVVTPWSIAGQLSEVRQAAAAFGIDAVADALERTAHEALAVTETEEGTRSLLVSFLPSPVRPRCGAAFPADRKSARTRQGPDLKPGPVCCGPYC